MIIGIDFDGVLTNISHFFDREGEIFAEENNIVINKNVNGYSTLEIFGWSKEDDSKYWEDNFLKYTKFVEPKKDASDVLSSLRKKGHKIIIVTSRFGCEKQNAIGKERRQISEEWLKENNIEYDEIIYTGEGNSKVPVVLNKNIDIFIDDSVKNLEEISKYIPVICFNESYNKNYINDKIKRCSSWKEILSLISKTFN